VNKANIEKLFAVFQKNNPEPETELEYINDYTLLVAIVLSAQATDVGVNKATKALFTKIDTPEKMLKLGEAGLKNYIKTIGLFNSKAKNVIALSEKLITEFDGKIPADLDKLQSLAGVGRKTANVFLNCAYGFETMGVDTHVHRVSNRLGLVKAKNVVETEKQLLKNIPKPYKKDAHHWLILHGRYICKARKPLCGDCPVFDLCGFKEKVK
jgi:endonuclease-3